MKAFVLYLTFSYFLPVGFSCVPGSYFREGTCVLCPAGFYQSQSGQFGCKPCPDGQIQPKNGSTTCIECSLNSLPSESRTVCQCKPGTIRMRITNECVICPAGTSSNFRFNKQSFPRPGIFNRFQDDCFPCAEDTFQPEAGQTDCLPCPGMTISNPNATICTTCPEGEVPIKRTPDLDPNTRYLPRLRESFYNWTSRKSNWECGKCPAGTSYNRELRQCRRCKEMYFKADEGDQPCLPCPPQTFSTQNRSSCIACEHGTALMEDGNCGKCPPGSYYTGSTNEDNSNVLATLPYCAECRVGYYTDSDNALRSCLSCPGNSFSFQAATECIECPPGKVLLKDQTCATCQPGTRYDNIEKACIPCGLNFYSRTENEMSCNICPPGSHSSENFSTCLLSDCPEGTSFIYSTGECGLCPPGMGFNPFREQCFPCSDGFYKPDEGNLECFWCGEGQASNENFTGCVSIPGFYD